jgi:hypothetical protein
VVLPAGHVLVVSPHLDDAILSCAALVDRAEPIDVVTVFSGAPDPPRRGWWDEETGFADSSESLPARRAEDRAAFAGTPHRLTYLDLIENQYLDGPRGEEEAAMIRAAVEGWCAEHPGGTVAVPAGAGGRGGRLGRVLELVGAARDPRPHADHLYVRDALLGVEAPLLLYEDLPYLFGGSADREARRIARALRRTAVEHVESIDRAAKARRVAAYTSQIPHISPDDGRLDDPAVLPAVERYWFLR